MTVLMTMLYVDRLVTIINDLNLNLNLNLNYVYLYLKSLYSMILLLSGDSCSVISGYPDTTALYQRGGYCYQFVSEEKYWTTARDYCNEVSSMLKFHNRQFWCLDLRQ